MVAAHPLPIEPPKQESTGDERRLVMRNLSFRDYVQISDVLVDRPGLHLTYLEGTLELMTVAPEHEHYKKLIARLLELFALLRGKRLLGFGSMTCRRESAERGLEPDECYYLDTRKEFPDLAIEVVVTRPLVDKLEVYRGLGVREVWVFRDKRFLIHELTGERYVERAKSALLPDLDLEVFTAHVLIADQDDAVRAYWAALSAK